MTEPLWRDGPWNLLIDLQQLVADRAPAEAQLGKSMAAAGRVLERRHERFQHDAQARFTAAKAEAEEENRQRCLLIGTRFEADQAAAQNAHETARREITGRFEADHHVLRDAFQEARWQAGTMYEAARGSIVTQINDVQAQWETQWKELDALHENAQGILRRRWLRGIVRRTKAVEGVPPGDDPFRKVNELCAWARQQVQELVELQVPRLFQGFRPLSFVLPCFLVAAVAAVFFFDWNWAKWAKIAAVTGGAGLGLSIVLGLILYRAGRAQSQGAYAALRQTLANALEARKAAAEAIKVKGDQDINALAVKRHGEIKKAEEIYNGKLAGLVQRRDGELRAADEAQAVRVAELAQIRDRDLQAAQTAHQARLAAQDAEYHTHVARLEEKYKEKLVELEGDFHGHWQAMADRWNTGMQRVQSSADDMNRACQQLFLDWHAADWTNWTPSTQIPSGIAFAQFDVDMARLDGGIPQDPRLRPARTCFTLPAMFPCRDRSLLLLKADGAGLPAATQCLQTIMLRMLTAMPPGKVRFTIVDPISLGENFAAFMHLADYNDQLVSSRIWTESSHIEHRLAELTGHMENVIQVYLRNEFQTIDEYNKFAGDLAEPYRVLVVANFPAGFSDPAAARLQSIVSSGARCGVFTVMSIDTRQRLPRGFQLADMEQHAVSLAWGDGRFTWENPDFGPLPMQFLQPPEAERFTAVVRSVGRAAKDADRVEVPFAASAPERPQWWTTESRDGIDVPLGRAGAMKFQYLRLGKGTSQHVLMAGKTGSGKSTLLHALITNVALRYSPDEVEMYLIDFKKGVEFKAYATAALPHARVIAIESEREFGLSVLERLDLELKQRGEQFRKLGVQDVPGFRESQPGLRLPRILLIVDEFQEMFVEDDRIAQQASLLLDRLVRQGRAFGIHVLLGSQTLAGAYSLPRSTIGQMAVRIALQCSESDAHLILSEENTAARLLKRPGEAIYNDANGLFEGNHPFQVVWLSEDQRENYLNAVRQLAVDRQCPPRQQIVFEGNAPADPARNEILQALVEAPSWPAAAQVSKAWLGSAVAIKEPTCAEFARQTGSHMLVVGHQEEAALGTLSMCVLSLAAQHPPRRNAAGQAEPLFYVFDGTRPDSPLVGMWSRLARAVPQEIRIVQARGVAGALNDIARELSRREEDGGEGGVEDHPPLYVVIYDVARFRDLRRSDDDFSFSSRGDDEKGPSPSAQLSRLLRDGPAAGIHLLLWCDTYSNVNRTLDRSGLREIEIRVLFQMNATDSSNLIDGPSAANLGVHRAVYYNEGQGRLEKFRPYGLPADAWLAWVSRKLHARLEGAAVRAAD